MEKHAIIAALERLNALLGEEGKQGELCLYGGAIMCLVHEVRPSTKDVDAIFQPAELLRKLARQVAAEMQLPDDWLNDGVKGFVVEHGRKVVMNLDHLMVYAADPEYLFAMKAMAARADTLDRADLKVLLNVLKIETLDQALKIIEGYYPQRQIKPATVYMLEELMHA